MQFDIPTASVTLAAVVLTVERGAALIKAAREVFGGASSSRPCAVDHEKMCSVLERVASVQEKTVEILYEQGTVLEVLKLMIDQQGGGRTRSLSPNTVELITELFKRRDEMNSARVQMSDPPPGRKKGGSP
jgi:hypothetical protein